MNAVPAAGTPAPDEGVRYLLAVGAMLTVLFAVMAPDVGFSAPFGWRLVFWALQVGAGLSVLHAVLRALVPWRGARRWPALALVVASALAGSVLLAPLYWWIGEGGLVPVLGLVADNDEPSAGFGLGAVAGEWLEIVGPVTLSWLLICLPRLPGLLPPVWAWPPAAAAPADPAPRALADAPAAPATAPAAAPGSPPAPALSPPTPVMPPPPMPTPTPAPAPVRSGDPSGPEGEWLRRLPTALGHDVIAVQSELQYLRVWTPAGSAMVLGALRDVEAALGDAAGLRVHRSYWVAARHVMAVRRRGDALMCHLGNGLAVPVSRRRRAEVLARFGDTAALGPAAAGPSLVVPAAAGPSLAMPAAPAGPSEPDARTQVQ